MFGIGGAELGVLLFAVILVISGLLPLWRICSKAGFSGWLSLTFLVPVVNIVVWYYLAFAEWPVHRELKALKAGPGA